MSNYTSPIEELIHTTVRIECKTSYGTTSGTGYFFQFEIDRAYVPCIITNKHVIMSSEQEKFYFTLQDEAGVLLGENIQVCIDKGTVDHWIPHPDPNIDLAILPIYQIVSGLEQEGKQPFYKTLRKENLADESLLNSLSSMEEIIMIGYPNGLWDKTHNLPIIRRGITATHPKLLYNSQPEFLIDAACFPGSSGSPVFLANIGSFVDSNGALCAGSRIALLGTLYAGPQHTATGEIVMMNIPIEQKPTAISYIPNNLGLVIHGNKLNDFEAILRTLVTNSLDQN